MGRWGDEEMREKGNRGERGFGVLVIWEESKRGNLGRGYWTKMNSIFFSFFFSISLLTF